MTGFGRSTYEIDGRTYNVEIKSVNHKYNDINIRLPKFLNPLEDEIRKQIQSSISRGKVDVYITFENYSDKGTNIKINKALAKEYLSELKDLATETGIPFEISIIEVSRLPDILKIEETGDEELISKELKVALVEAIDNFVQMRTVEGEKLAEDMKKRIDWIEVKIKEISEYSSKLVDEYIEKLGNRVKELMKTDVVDEVRLAQEIVIYSDKCSIEEELTRLYSHISQFNTLLQGTSPIGKKFDFLVQEMNREINTIGSKANCLEITNRVIDIKTEIENIREQIQNIE
jgi:uncharacterized protein (TIGR00255 family)